MDRIVGNDVASFQGDINFDTYKNNTHFVIIKATEGTGFTDPKLSRNQSEARRTGIILGYYHFARPTLGNDAIKEADYFLSKVGALQEGEILCLDFEETYPDAVNWCKKFLDYVYQKTGVRAFIYMDQSRVVNYNWKAVVDGGYALWIAAYTYDPYKNTFKTGAWPAAAMQQWTNQQNVPGIQNGTGKVDGDVFFGTKDILKKYGYKAPPPPPPAVDWEKKYNDEHAAFEDYKLRFNQSTQDTAVKSALQVLNDRIDKAQIG